MLDGHLIGEQSEEVNLAELLEIARKEFAEGGTLLTVDESELEKEWPPLRSQLSAAVRAWRLKGLELTAAITSLENSIPLLESAVNMASDSSPEPFHLPPTPQRVLDIQGEDLNFLAGLPLFDLA